MLWYLQLCSLAYNVEHGIVPAAIPQIRSLFASTAFEEAAVQCVCVLGTQLGVGILVFRKVQFSKYWLLASIATIAVNDVGTGMLLRAVQQENKTMIDVSSKLSSLMQASGIGKVPSSRLPAWLFVLRFLAGISAAYPIHCIPRYINQASLQSQAAARQACVQLAGVVGNMVGYVLVLLPSKIRVGAHPDDVLTSTLLRFLLAGRNFTVSFKLAGLVCALTSVIGMCAIRSRQFMSRSGEAVDQAAYLPIPEDDFDDSISLRIVKMEDDVLYSSDACDTSQLNMPLPHVNSGSIVDRWFDSILLSTTPLYSKVSPVHRYTHPPDGIGTLQQIGLVLRNVEFVCLTLLVWINTSVSQALAFWIFTVYTTRFEVSKALALTGITLIFGVGTVCGLGLASLVRIPEDDGGSSKHVKSQRLLIVTLFCALCSLMGVLCAVLTNGFYALTALMMLSVIFGAAVIPIVQASVGAECVSQTLEDTAYGMYQTVFQSSWFFGPLLPVVLARAVGGSADVEGFRGVMVLPVLALGVSLFAYQHSKSCSSPASEPYLTMEMVKT